MSDDEMAKALRDFSDALKKQNEYSREVVAVSLDNAWRHLANVLSGEIAGKGFQSRRAAEPPPLSWWRKLLKRIRKGAA